MADSATIPATSAGYAIVETGGKQYRVSVGDTIIVEKLASDAGSEITLDKVLLVGGAGGAQIGAPYVSGATVSATVDAHGKGEKIVVFKYKPKKRYRRRIGHRQQQTTLTITGINA
jgi:large subunit ribosomal protein L21